MVLTKSNMIYSYINWLNNQVTQADISGWIEITTPFLDGDNDCIQVYARMESDKIILSDFGDTIRSIRFSGWVIPEEHFTRCLEITTNRFGIRCDDEYVLSAEVTLDKLPQKLNDLIQCIAAVSNFPIFAR